MKLYNSLPEYTESEFITLLSDFFENTKNLKGDDQLAHLENLRTHLDEIVGHPSIIDLIYFPEPGTEDSPKGVITVIKAWLAENNKPGFKSE